eukprot:286669-Rhodomonas_salina.6
MDSPSIPERFGRAFSASLFRKPSENQMRGHMAAAFPLADRDQACGLCGLVSQAARVPFPVREVLRTL